MVVEVEAAMLYQVVMVYLEVLEVVVQKDLLQEVQVILHLLVQLKEWLEEVQHHLVEIVVAVVVELQIKEKLQLG